MNRTRSMVLMVPASAMLVCLGAFALSSGGALAAKQENPNASSSAKQAPPDAVPVRAMTAADLKGKAGEEIRSRQQNFNDALAQKEASIVGRLGLNADQMERYDALQAELKRQTAEMMAEPSGHIERGMEINKYLHTNLKEIFTPEQYSLYMQLWGPSSASVTRVSSKKKLNAPVVKDPMANGSPFAGTDEDVLGRIRPKLTQKQWDAYAALRVEMDAMNQELYTMIREGRGREAGFFSVEINQANLEGMKTVLKPDQYQQWLDMWDEVMAPFVVHGDPGTARAVVVPAEGSGAGAAPATGQPAMALPVDDPRDPQP